MAKTQGRRAICSKLLIPVIILALIPPISGYIGTTTRGWRIGAGDPVMLDPGNAVILSILYFLAILAAIFSVALMIKWMGQTYGSDQPFSRCLTLSVFIPTPLLLIGIAQLYPILWLNLVIALPALAYSIMLLYTGIPVLMEIPKERGFIFFDRGPRFWHGWTGRNVSRYCFTLGDRSGTYLY